MNKPFKVQNDILKIYDSLKKGFDVRNAVKSLVELLSYIDEFEVGKYVTKIQQLLTISNDKEVIKSYSKIVRYYESKKMFDEFFDFYWLNKNESLEFEIKSLYEVFGDYYYKYYRELSGNENFSEIIAELELKCKKDIETW